MIRFKLNLRTRIYLSMLFIITMSFVVTGGIALYDHHEQGDKYNEQRLERKEKSVKASMEYFLNQQEGRIHPDSIRYAFEEKICELSDVHNMFIALFDLRGNYLISTNSNTMDSLQLPYTVPYTVMKQLVTGEKRAVVHSEVGENKIASVYWYFEDNTGKPLAVTCAVYEKSDMEGKNVFLFLGELLQSYVLLFLMAALVAYLLSTYITRSLQEIGEKMKGVQLGAQNAPLKWASNDEIGSLVKEYNRMLAELEKSATMLAQEERESAWREMAKQVAHEIKNPLTPMKLRVQHLLRSWDDQSPDFDKKLKVYVQSMTEQIDTLSRIANEFSNFAKMPKPNLELMDAVDLVKSASEIYYNQEKYDFNLRIYHVSNPMVMADKDQMVRVINNLITNAIQAVPEGRRGNIDVAVRECKNRIIIRVNDNGVGISEEGKGKIFVPNFTTKSTGTGLGLAMVKNIMNHSGGRVFFWSKEGKGASFYIELTR
ncbi:MAG: sensor histidine kinase [Flavobacteriales bacterium]|jgi:signal transduction histidine kinase